jgi:hypothetical protein
MCYDDVAKFDIFLQLPGIRMLYNHLHRSFLMFFMFTCFELMTPMPVMSMELVYKR